jgi:hypothetical protein
MEDKVKKSTGNPAERFGGPGPGRPKGMPNKSTTLLKDAILEAATNHGNKVGGNGLVSYLEDLVATNQNAFATLVGKVLPMQITGDAANPVGITFTTVYQSKEADK